MTAFNLVRNTRVFFTTNVGLLSGVSNAVLATGMIPANTVEIQVLDGFSFKQGTQTANVQLKEAGDTPVRGQRTFNTSLDPVDFSFSTYIRPVTVSSKATAEEKVLWNALTSALSIDTTGVAIGGTITGITRTDTNAAVATIAGTTLTYVGISVGDFITVAGATGTSGVAYEWNQPAVVTSLSATAIGIRYISAPAVSAGTTTTLGTLKFFKGSWVEQPAVSPTSSYAVTSFAGSNKNQLQPFGIIFVVDGATYIVDNCAMDQAVLDFGLDAIATLAWTGKGTRLRQLSASQASLSGTTFTGTDLAGTVTAKNTSANYITNKLSTVTLISNIAGIGGTSYQVALTGGSITFANGITYITPQNLGVVNNAIGYFTGTRAISGTMTAYLRTGTNTTAQLLTDVLANSSTATDTRFRLQLEIGGRNNATRVEIEMDGAMLQVPTVETADVVSTTIAFTAQSTTANTTTPDYDLENTNDANIRYYSA